MTASDEALTKWHASRAKVIAKAWGDDGFKAKLLSDPLAALTEAGIRVPAGVRVEVLEDTADTLHLVLPRAPDDDLSDEALEKIAAGLTFGLAQSG